MGGGWLGMRCILCCSSVLRVLGGGGEHRLGRVLTCKWKMSLLNQFNSGKYGEEEG